MKVLSVTIKRLASAARDKWQILLSVPLDQSTAYRQVYAGLVGDWEKQGQSPVHNWTTEEEMDIMLMKALAFLQSAQTKSPGSCSTNPCQPDGKDCALFFTRSHERRTRTTG